ncbi:ABC transporter [Bordetella genomosp. 1]|uniref:ABC transporter n=1 Tax=Bordetella genomosp. 1 TaxID=1395607 RepID=A0A261SDG2_9BORD|nr:ABC transporter ATP-binding protein [Bordetella genomosp. 1]MDQ8031636.1 ABC transporter ATP-binding protein [Bordetella sp.]OZI35449.1 ABC transporter [Bordetella genomosp. 1]
MAALIEFDRVSQFFATRGDAPAQALHDVSLQVQAGEFVCLIGPSGCGKTTLLHLLAGFLQPTEGTVAFHGAAVTRPGPERGVVFQEYALFPWMTARQNVEFGLRAQSVPAGERRERALAALRRVGLAHAAERYPHELSGGMRQRIAVARSLVVEPKVLLMDEPFAAVDAMTRATLQQDLLRLWQETGVSVLFVTHNIDEAIFLAQRAVVMAPHPGTLAADIAIDLPYPRQRGSLEFARYYNQIEAALAAGTHRHAA